MIHTHASSPETHLGVILSCPDETVTCLEAVCIRAHHLQARVTEHGARSTCQVFVLVLHANSHTWPA